MRRDSGNAGGFRIGLEKLPDDLLAQRCWLDLIASAHWAEYVSSGYAGCSSPTDLYPRWHRHSANAPVLANKIDNAPAPIPSLNVPKRERRNFRPSQTATQEYREDGSVAQALFRRRIRCVQQTLGLPNGEPVS